MGPGGAGADGPRNRLREAELPGDLAALARPQFVHLRYGFTDRDVAEPADTLLD